MKVNYKKLLKKSYHSDMVHMSMSRDEQHKSLWDKGRMMGSDLMRRSQGGKFPEFH
jgi:hypothetical protein